MSKHPDDHWKTLGSAALRVLMQAERQMRAEKVFGPVTTDDDLRALYPKPTAEAAE